jgi:hypothetical protein
MLSCTLHSSTSPLLFGKLRAIFKTGRKSSQNLSKQCQNKEKGNMNIQKNIRQLKRGKLGETTIVNVYSPDSKIY